MKLHNFRILQTVLFFGAIFAINALESQLIDVSDIVKPANSLEQEGLSGKYRNLAVDVSNYKNFEKLIDEGAMVSFL